MKLFSKKDAEDGAIEDVANHVYGESAMEYNVFYGGLVMATRWWRGAFFVTNLFWCAVAVLLVIVIMMIYNAGGNHVFAVPTNAKGVVTGPAVEVSTAMSPTDAEVQSRLDQLTQALFSVSVDPVVTRHNLDFVNDFTTGEAAGYINGYYAQNRGQLSPFVRGRYETVEVVVNKIGSISPQTYEVDWTEIERDFKGNQLSRQDKSASFNVAVLPPQTRAAAVINPFGVYVTRLRFINSLGGLK